MIVTGIGDEAGNAIETQITACRELGWQHLEMRGVEEYAGHPKANFHDIPDEAFDTASRAAGKVRSGRLLRRVHNHELDEETRRSLRDYAGRGESRPFAHATCGFEICADHELQARRR